MSNRVLIENGTVIDGTGAAPRPNEAVLIDGDAIAATGQEAADRARQMNDVERLDAAGHTVMPGLIDVHCHLSFDETQSNDEFFFHRREGLSAIITAYHVKKLLCAGITGVLDPDCIFDVSLDVRDAIEARIIPGPRMVCGGNALFTSVGGTAGLLVPDEGKRGYMRVVRNKDEIVTEVRRQIKNGVDWIKVHVTGIVPRRRHEGEISVWNMEELRTVVNAAHDLGIPVVGHCRNAGSTRDAAKAGFDLIYHATFMDEEALEAVTVNKTALSPGLGFQANLRDYGTLIGTDPTIKEIFEKEIAGSGAMLKKAWDAGCPVLPGSETGFAVTPYGLWHFREMEVLVKDIGIPPLEVIKSATKQAAWVIGLDGKTGEIAPGKLADVIVVDGDPVKDITVLRKDFVRHVFLGGKKMDITWPADDQRRPIPGWKVNQFANKHLTYELVAQAQSGSNGAGGRA